MQKIIDKKGLFGDQDTNFFHLPIIHFIFQYGKFQDIRKNAIRMVIKKMIKLLLKKLKSKAKVRISLSIFDFLSERLEVLISQPRKTSLTNTK